MEKSGEQAAHEIRPYLNASSELRSGNEVSGVTLLGMNRLVEKYGIKHPSEVTEHQIVETMNEILKENGVLLQFSVYKPPEEAISA